MNVSRESAAITWACHTLIGENRENTHKNTHTKKNKHRPLGISLYENIIKHFGSNPKRVNVTWAVSKTFWKIPNNTSLVIRYEQKLWEFPDNDQSTRCVLQNHCIEAATLDCKRLIKFINTKRKNHQNTLRKHYLRNLGARNCLWTTDTWSKEV